jgi:putative ABC transport system permease protein
MARPLHAVRDMAAVQDVRIALRRIRRNPLFALSVIGTLALGVGATTSIYTVVDGVLLKPLPFSEPQALVRVSADFQGLDLRDVGLSQPELADYAARSGAFEAIAGVWAISANLTGSDRPERIEALVASANYFDLLGARAALGRTFTAADEVPGIATVAVISDGLWRRGFGANPNVLGRTLRIDEDVYEIIGVMPPSFRHPSQTLETDVDVWSPAGWTSAPFGAPAYSARFVPFAIGRLARGMSVETARARVESLGREIVRQHPDDYPARLGWTPRLRPLAADLVAGVRPVLVVLMGAIVCVLLIAVSNISNLLLIRAVAREREVAVQRALGATRWRIMSSVLAEGAALAVAGGALGFLASLWGVDLLLRLVPDRLPRVADISVDQRVFLFAMVTATLAGLLVGLGPALQLARPGVVDHLRSAGKGPQGGIRARLRSVLVVGQVAIAVVLLAGAALLVRSLWNLQTVNTGLAVSSLLTARLWLPQPNEPSTGPYFDHAKRVVMIRGVTERLHASPEVTHAGLTTALPTVSDSGSASFAVEGSTPDQRDLAVVTPVSVTPGYFPALGITLLRGRLLADTDDDRAPRAVVINDTLARTYFRTEDPIGRRFRFVSRRGQVSDKAPWITIVGVVSDIKEDGLDTAVRPQIFQSLLQASTLNLAIVTSGRSGPPPAAVVQRAIQSVDPNLPVYAVRSGEDLVATQLAQRRFATRLINAFAVTALFLAAFGLHGVIAYGVRQRTHEIGVRIALGATVARVMALVFSQAAWLTGAGILIGSAAAIVLSRFLRTMLFEISPTDPWTLAGTVTLLAAVVGLATLGAARRAARIEPAIALRQE